MLKMVTLPIRKFLNGFGYEIVKLQDSLTSVKVGNWLHKLNIQTILDIGSNEGQFIHTIIKTLPGKKIYAFEPIASCYQNLLLNTKGMNVTAYHCGLSDMNGESVINVSDNLVSSSILGMKDLHKRLYPESEYTKQERITLRRLDDVFDGKQLEPGILIKIDVQGYEEKVLAGGGKVIAQASAIICETSFAPLYDGQWLFGDVYHYFIQDGYRFIGFADQSLSKITGAPLYGDAIFVKNELCNSIFQS